VALAVVLTPTLTLLHTHTVPHGQERHPDVGTGHTHVQGHDHQDGNPHHDDHGPASDDQASCGLCHLLHQARADLSTPVPAVATFTRTGYRPKNPPHSPLRALTVLSDAPPRGPPAL